MAEDGRRAGNVMGCSSCGLINRSRPIIQQRSAPEFRKEFGTWDVRRAIE